MNFKFSPSKNEFEYREYINYRTMNTVFNKIYITCVKLLGYILVFINIFKLFNKNKFASNITTAILLLFFRNNSYNNSYMFIRKKDRYEKI